MLPQLQFGGPPATRASAPAPYSQAPSQPQVILQPSIPEYWLPVPGMPGFGSPLVVYKGHLVLIAALALARPIGLRLCQPSFLRPRRNEAAARDPDRLALNDLLTVVSIASLLALVPPALVALDRLVVTSPQQVMYQ